MFNFFSDGCHPTEEDVAAFIDGMLEEERKEEVKAHLADCQRCKELHSEARACLQELDREGLDKK